MDDQGNPSPQEEEGKQLLDLLQFLEVVAPEESRQAALDRGLPNLALDLLIERANSDDPVVREEARALVVELGLHVALPDLKPGMPGDE